MYVCSRVCAKGAAIGGGMGGYIPPLKNLGGPPMYWPPPHFYRNIYFDWSVPPTYTPSFQPPYYAYVCMCVCMRVCMRTHMLYKSIV